LEEGLEAVTDDLVTWLRAQLDDDERLALKALDIAPGGWVSSYRDVHAIDPESGTTHHVLTAESGALAWHAARHDPARVLADVTADRALLDLAHQLDRSADCEAGPAATQLYRTLAAKYATWPGYRPEWGPQ
jgi:hypothetical protein